MFHSIIYCFKVLFYFRPMDKKLWRKLHTAIDREDSESIEVLISRIKALYEEESAMIAAVRQKL